MTAPKKAHAQNFVPWRTEFGSVAILRMPCPKCGFMSFVIDGKSACCDEPIDQPSKYRRKRESDGEQKRCQLSASKKEIIIESQDNKCIYCQRPFGTPVYCPKRKRVIIPEIHFDHFVCWSFSRNTSVGNMVAACSICNLIKGDKLFENIDYARAFIMRRRYQKGYEDEMSPMQ